MEDHKYLLLMCGTATYVKLDTKTKKFKIIYLFIFIYLSVHRGKE